MKNLKYFYQKYELLKQDLCYKSSTVFCYALLNSSCQQTNKQTLASWPSGLRRRYYSDQDREVVVQTPLSSRCSVLG